MKGERSFRFEIGFLRPKQTGGYGTQALPTRGKENWQGPNLSLPGLHE